MKVDPRPDYPRPDFTPVGTLEEVVYTDSVPEGYERPEMVKPNGKISVPPKSNITKYPALRTYMQKAKLIHDKYGLQIKNLVKRPCGTCEIEEYMTKDDYLCLGCRKKLDEL